MTKQEQIEEMAKIIDEMYYVYTTTADDIAEGLYNAGYRKLDDHAIMVLRKAKGIENRIRKETAEEILNAVVGAIDNGTFFRQNFIFMMNKVYGVELQNANNDKTIEQANKKIVRQFYNKIQKMLDETRQVIEEPCNGRQNAGYCVADVDNGLKELAKQFGLEIKE